MSQDGTAKTAVTVLTTARLQDRREVILSGSDADEVLHGSAGRAGSEQSGRERSCAGQYQWSVSRSGKL